MKMENDIQIFRDQTALAAAAAGMILQIANAAIHQRGRFTLALSGGHSPEDLYAQLSNPPFRDEIPWDNTFIFWGDERCVPADDPQHNAFQARQLLLNRVEIPRRNIFPIHCYVSPPKAAIRYEKTISDFFGNDQPRFDLILLGLGENGHTASLFPASDALQQHKRLVTNVFVEAQEMFRVTMTAHLINQAHNIIFLAMGPEKAAILNEVLYGAYDPEKLPAQSIRPMRGKIYWFVDSAAASFLAKHI